MSEKYVVRHTAFGFQVEDPAGKRVTVTHMTRGGEVHVETKPMSALIPDYRPSPLLAAAYARSGYWIIDLDVGLQRWHGEQSSRRVAKYLRSLGFSDATVRTVFRHAKRVSARRGVWCPWFC